MVILLAVVRGFTGRLKSSSDSRKERSATNSLSPESEERIITVSSKSWTEDVFEVGELLFEAIVEKNEKVVKWRERGEPQLEN